MSVSQWHSILESPGLVWCRQYGIIIKSNTGAVWNLVRSGSLTLYGDQMDWEIRCRPHVSLGPLVYVAFCASIYIILYRKLHLETVHIGKQHIRGVRYAPYTPLTWIHLQIHPYTQVFVIVCKCGIHKDTSHTFEHIRVQSPAAITADILQIK